MIKNIVIAEDLIYYLERKWLSGQYKKLKDHILRWLSKQINLEIEDSENKKIYYFRIDKQFRVIAELENNKLMIFDIDNNQ
jgi:mRNA-degrading endonuclease RelE of RelBE toxin-antitoxin system